MFILPVSGHVWLFCMFLTLFEMLYEFFGFGPVVQKVVLLNVDR